MYMDSLIVLAKLCYSLPTMVKLSSVVGWPVVHWWPYMVEGAFRCSLNVSPNVLAESLMYFITVQPIAPMSVYYTTLFGPNPFMLPGCS